MNLKSMTLPELSACLKEMGQPAFRAKQVYTWLHKGVHSYEEMTNIPQTLRAVLAEKFPICPPQVVRKQESQKDGTIKYLWKLHDGNCVETVLMRYHYGNTVCISTEVGCRMGCAFCASTLGGLVRKLEPFEMLNQVFEQSIRQTVFVCPSTVTKYTVQKVNVCLFNGMKSIDNRNTYIFGYITNIFPVVTFWNDEGMNFIFIKIRNIIAILLNGCNGFFIIYIADSLKEQ